MTKKDSGSLASDDSFVDVAPLNLDFVIKIGVNENGVTKHHRLRVRALVESSCKPEDGSNGTISYSKLLEEFGSRACMSVGDVEFTYRDVDGDLCVVKSTEDLAEAIRQCSGAGSLKLQATCTQKGGIPSGPGIRMPSGASKPSSICGSDIIDDFFFTGMKVMDLAAKSRVVRAMQGHKDFEDMASFSTSLDANPELVLAHLLNEFKDHLNLDFTPAFFLDPVEISDNGGLDDDEIQLMVEYKLQDDQTNLVRSPYFAMDDIYLDLTEDLGIDTVRLAVPTIFLTRIMTQTGGCPPIPPDACPPATCLDPLEVLFDPNDSPIVVSYNKRKKVDKSKDTSDEISASSGNSTSSIEIEQKGRLSEILKDPEYHHFYKVSGVFTARQVVLDDEETVFDFRPDGPRELGLTLSLVAVVLYSEQDEVLESLKNGSCL